MASSFGKNIKVTLFGESHGELVGVVVDGIAPGMAVDFAALQRMLDRRKPGKSALTTGRSEADTPKIVSGVLNGVTTGTPICALFENADTRSGEYEQFSEIARPGHADYVAYKRYGGHSDPRGGGHFSARLTVGLTFAGALAKQQLGERGISLCAHMAQVGGVKDDPLPLQLKQSEIERLQQSPFPLVNPKNQSAMEAEVLRAKEAEDSVGGQIACMAVGLPAGMGDPIFDGVESILSHLLFSIPAVKAVEFGAGVMSANMRGSKHNPSLKIEDNKVVETTNHNGGVLGGITNGMPLVCKVTFKPTPSIAREQQTVNFRTGEKVSVEIKGRHDPCVALRAAPVVEGAVAVALLDILLGGGGR